MQLLQFPWQRLKQGGITAEGAIVFGLCGYETLALSVNTMSGKRVIPPITDILGPLTHHKYGWLIPGFLIAWGYRHFWRNGEVYQAGRMSVIHEMQALDT